MNVFITLVRWVHQLAQVFGQPSRLPFILVKHQCLEYKRYKRNNLHCYLTNVVKPNPVCGIHFFLDVPRYDKVVATVQRVLQSGRRQRGSALGGHQVCVAVSASKPNGTADNRDAIDSSGAAPLRQSPQVLRAEGVSDVGAASSWG